MMRRRWPGVEQPEYALITETGDPGLGTVQLVVKGDARFLPRRLDYRRDRLIPRVIPGMIEKHKGYGTAMHLKALKEWVRLPFTVGQAPVSQSTTNK
jgi:hypothetical protein